jgi:hypothetical protein
MVRWIEANDIVAYQLRRPARKGCGTEDYVIAIRPQGPFGASLWEVVTGRGPTDRPSPKNTMRVYVAHILRLAAHKAARIASRSIKNGGYSVILATQAKLTQRFVVPNVVWAALKAILVNRGLWFPRTGDPDDVPRLLGHVAMDAESVLHPAHGSYLFVREWDYSHVALEMALDENMTGYLGIAASLAWALQGDQPVFRQPPWDAFDTRPRALVADPVLDLRIVALATDVGLIARPAAPVVPATIDYARIMMDTKWTSLL